MSEEKNFTILKKMDEDCESYNRQLKKYTEINKGPDIVSLINKVASLLSGAKSPRLDIQEVSSTGAIATAIAAEPLGNIGGVSAFVIREKEKPAGETVSRREQVY